MYLYFGVLLNATASNRWPIILNSSAQSCSMNSRVSVVNGEGKRSRKSRGSIPLRAPWDYNYFHNLRKASENFMQINLLHQESKQFERSIPKTIVKCFVTKLYARQSKRSLNCKKHQRCALSQISVFYTIK